MTISTYYPSISAIQEMDAYLHQSQDAIQVTDVIHTKEEKSFWMRRCVDLFTDRVAFQYKYPNLTLWDQHNALFKRNFAKINKLQFPLSSASSSRPDASVFFSFERTEKGLKAFLEACQEGLQNKPKNVTQRRMETVKTVKLVWEAWKHDSPRPTCRALANRIQVRDYQKIAPSSVSYLYILFDRFTAEGWEIEHIENNLSRIYPTLKERIIREND